MFVDGELSKTCLEARSKNHLGAHLDIEGVQFSINVFCCCIAAEGFPVLVLVSGCVSLSCLQCVPGKWASLLLIGLHLAVRAHAQGK